MVIMNAVLTLLIVESPTLSGLLNSISYAGMMVGNLVFGVFADFFGPRVAGLTAATLGIAGATFAATAGTVMSLPIQLLLGRLVVGVAVGGEYPICAIISKLKCGTHFTERQLLICSMVMTTIGTLSSNALYLILIATPLPNHLIWRILLAAAGLPSLACLVLRGDLDLPAQAQSTGQPRESGCSERGSYGSRLIMHFGENWCSYLIALCALVISQGICNLNGVYCHTVVEHTVGDAVNQQRVLLYNGIQTFAQSVMLLAGALSAYAALAYINIVCAQSMAMFVAASTTLLEVLLRHQYPFLSLASAALVQFPMGFAGATTYTILTETFPLDVAGAFTGIAVTILKIAQVITTFLFPTSVYTYGLETTQLIEVIALLLGCIATLSLLQTQKRSSQHGIHDARLPSVVYNNEV